jgi:hypothetical protein
VVLGILHYSNTLKILSRVGRTELAALPELLSQSTDVVNDRAFHDQSFSERCSGNVRPGPAYLLASGGCQPSGTLRFDRTDWNTRELQRTGKLTHAAHRGGFNCHCSSKKSAATTFPGQTLLGGVLRSITAQSGSIGTWRALLR